VNGYKFHIEDKSQGKKTFNSGICVIGTGEGGIVDDYYSILKDVIELVYPQEPTKKCVLFSCDWFDPTINHGMRAHQEFGIVGIHRSRRYNKYEPFIFGETATQVFYTPYPARTREKVDWWVVIKTKPRAMVDNSYTLELAYQEEMMCNVSVTSNDVPLENMRNDYGHLEEVGFDVLMTNEEGDIANAEEDTQVEDEEEDIEEEDEYEDEKQEEDNVEFSIEENDDD